MKKYLLLAILSLSLANAQTALIPVLPPYSSSSVKFYKGAGQYYISDWVSNPKYIDLGEKSFSFFFQANGSNQTPKEIRFRNATTDLHFNIADKAIDSNEETRSYAEFDLPISAFPVSGNENQVYQVTTFDGQQESEAVTVALHFREANTFDYNSNDKLSLELPESVIAINAIQRINDQFLIAIPSIEHYQTYSVVRVKTVDINHLAELFLQNSPTISDNTGQKYNVSTNTSIASNVSQETSYQIFPRVNENAKLLTIHWNDLDPEAVELLPPELRNTRVKFEIDLVKNK